MKCSHEKVLPLLAKATVVRGEPMTTHIGLDQCFSTFFLQWNPL